jgi:predicted metallopeptidase
MGIKYFQADDIKKEAEEICKIMEWDHIDFENLGFLRSTGSVAPRTIARCHALGKAMQIAMGRKTGFYLVEVISEKFDRLPETEKTKTIIHELMHIPKTFGGGFIHHNMVHEGSVRDIYKKYLYLKQNKEETTFPSMVQYEKPIQVIQQPISPAALVPNLKFKETMQKAEKKFRWF